MTSKSIRLKIPKRAFTLIELLVVVAIIALLVSILLPSLKKARDQAKLTSCLANLHDFGIAHQQYAMENKGYFPLKSYMGAATNFAAGDDNLFVLWYRKYARNLNSFTCPATTFRIRQPTVLPQPPHPTNGLIEYQFNTPGSAFPNRSDFREIAQSRTPAQGGTNNEPGYGTSYEYMAWTTCGGGQTRNNWHPIYYNTMHDGQPKTTNIGKPAPHVSMLMHDADDSEATGAPSGVAINNYPEPWDNHGTRGMNILFADGHSETVRPYMLGPGTSRIWNRNDCVP